MKFSKFAHRFSANAGIVQLMDDLGSAMAGNDMLMLGGGNPSHIPQVLQYFHERLQRIIDSPSQFTALIGNYDSPQGEPEFIAALVAYLNDEYGWKLTNKNIALTSGSQAGFFALFNMFTGEYESGQRKKCLLPVSPEYIGYKDIPLEDDLLISQRPLIEKLGEHFFKYHVDFENLVIDESIGAICVSRPSNPTGNVITEQEIHKLSELADEHSIPLIIDNAYGLPFPNIIFEETKPFYNDNTILCMSLSKLGLPGCRTGIVIANEEVISHLSSMTAIMNLSQGSIGPALAYDVINSGEITSLCKNVIKPYYESRKDAVVEWIKELFTDIDYFIHKPEGAIFLWLWFPELTITNQILYEKLKEQGVLVLSGHHFFPGLNDEWEHKQQCIRITYSQSPEVVRKALEIIAEEVKQNTR